MLKILHLLKEQEESKPLKRSEVKILKHLAKKFIHYFPEEKNDVKVFETIRYYLKETFALNPQQILSLYYLLINNIEYIIDNESESWVKDPIIGYDADEHYTGDDEDILGKFLNIPPNFIGDSDYPYYAMDQYYLETNGNHYAIGTYEQVKHSLNMLVDNMIYGLSNQSPVSDWLNSELYHIHGESYIIEHMFIPKEIQREIADETANRIMEEDYIDEEDILRQIEHYRPDIGNEWANLEEEKYELERQLVGDEDDDVIHSKITDVEKEIEKLGKQAKEIIHEEEYDITLESMSNPLDFLWEHGYINRVGNGWEMEDTRAFKSMDSERVKILDWVRVDIDAIKKDLNVRSDFYRLSDLARYDGEEHQVEHNGETYYIYKTE